jgi:5-methylcytosine-specific restriction endonuclease McrA
MAGRPPTTRERGYGGAWQRARRTVLARDGRICWICRLPGADAVDHLDPIAERGPALPPLERLAAVHTSCNLRRARELERAKREQLAPSWWPARPQLVTGPPGRRVWWGAIQPEDLQR